MADDKGSALVTGASSGIGLELARCFADDGHAVVITADDGVELAGAARELGASGARSATVEADLPRRDGVRHLYNAVSSRHGTPDYLVTTPGGTSTATLRARPTSKPSCGWCISMSSPWSRSPSASRGRWWRAAAAGS